ncbi:MAG TPA: HAMP domain-containing sensor histidine kinase [Thermodesulfovibrionales bacterium]|nr:HAMP domain-containing sensor histidine kinase [Thermodesulfovibrionales bacterium]
MEGKNFDLSVPGAKENAIASIESAKTELEHALAELNDLPTLDPNVIRYAAHAIKNYLTVAGGCVALLSHALGDSANEQVKTWLEGLQHATKLMIQTVRLLSNAAVAVKLDLKWEKVDLPLLVQRGCEYYADQARGKRVAVVFEPAVEPVYAWTDRVVVAAVLDNLLSNAVKFSASGGVIRVSVIAEPSYVVCSVQDNGPGLTPEDQAKLFQPGARLGPSPTGTELSTGYGLAISKDMIQALNGHIWCESNVGLGSCFSFRLPLYEGQDKAATPSHVSHVTKKQHGAPSRK